MWASEQFLGQLTLRVPPTAKYRRSWEGPLKCGSWNSISDFHLIFYRLFFSASQIDWRFPSPSFLVFPTHPKEISLAIWSLSPKPDCFHGFVNFNQVCRSLPIGAHRVLLIELSFPTARSLHILCVAAITSKVLVCPWAVARATLRTYLDHDQINCHIAMPPISICKDYAGFFGQGQPILSMIYSVREGASITYVMSCILHINQCI